ncbi:hypothetical protein [Akkermansia glycaniphila]|uniref:Uncharacterized protein n=1 Tax=Akkermansia glycaniphila TaxID=1679444 RepID=A0A1C7P9K6_9BACT|nr:hypothetical protein [Akkermansia glycaniphila]OCA02168.1 hypothetical protein AC781_11445 [Akkermansia glycaniphila]SEH99569.1 Hypothetical protein PYTT_2408 [Akkermansia glycaniphila]
MKEELKELMTEGLSEKLARFVMYLAQGMGKAEAWAKASKRKKPLAGDGTAASEALKKPEVRRARLRLRERAEKGWEMETPNIMFKLKDLYEDVGVNDDGTQKVPFSVKLKAMRMMLQILGSVTQKVEVSGSDELKSILEAMRIDVLPRDMI